MTSKVLMCVCFSVVISGGAFLVGHVAAATGSEWMISVDETVNGTPGQGGMSFLCLRANFNSLPEKITGPQCGGQAFQRTPDRLSWTLACKALSGGGDLTFSADGNTFQGDVHITKGDQTITRHIEGEVQDQCSV